MSGAWGSDAWGSSGWGGGTVDAAAAVSATALAYAYRENVIQVAFSSAVSIDGFLGTTDASVPARWLIVEDASTVGIDGDPARHVNVVSVTLATTDDGVAPDDVGRYLNLALDRPMSPWPSSYTVRWTGLYDATGLPLIDGSAVTQGTYRVIEKPTVTQPRPSRDFANPQTTAAAQEQVQNPTGPFALGSFGISDDGDYAYDEGVQNLKKRVLRRLFTRKNAFAHLAGYGVSIPDRVKQLGSANTLASIRTDAESQIAQEPDVDKVKVMPVVDSDAPSILRLRIAIRPTTGAPIAFEVPFDLTS
jgi:hypothetical protein